MRPREQNALHEPCMGMVSLHGTFSFACFCFGVEFLYVNGREPNSHIHVSKRSGETEVFCFLSFFGENGLS